MFGKRLAELRRKRSITQTQLAKEIGMSHSTVASWEIGTRDPNTRTVTKLAEFFNVSTDYLIGESVGALIEKKLEQRNMTMEELSSLIKVPVRFLKDIDAASPNPWDYEKGGILDRISKALDIPFRDLSSAFYQQEPPGYDGPPDTRSVEEIFGDENFEETMRDEVKTLEQADAVLKPLGTNIIEVVEKELTDNQILTLAAQRVGHTGKLTDEDIRQIKKALRIALDKD